MTVDPSDKALITAGDARIYLGLASTDKPTDDWLNTVINGISTQVMEYTGIRYRPLTDDGVTRSFEYIGGLTVGIDETESVTKVEYSNQPNIAESWIEVELAQYALEPLAETVKDHIRLIGSLDVPTARSGWDALRRPVMAGESMWPTEAAAQAQRFLAVRVTGKWGVTEIPDHVRLALMFWIKQLMNRDISLMSSELAQASIVRGMPADVQAILDGIVSAAGAVEAV